MVNVGIVGYGFAGRRFHAYLIGLVPELHIQAVVTRDPVRRQQAQTDLACTVYDSATALLRDPAIDLVVLATPHNTHAQLAIQAMNAGKHVVTDKVMCLTVEEADAMIAARDRNGVLLSVFHNRRWDWDYLTIKEVLHQGLLGRVASIEQAVVNHRPPRGWRAHTAESGGVLFDWGAHLVDQLLQLVPASVQSIWCGIATGAWDVDVGNYAKLILRFSDSTLAEVNTGNIVRQAKPRWFIIGDHGTLLKEGLDPQERAMLSGDINRAQEDPAQQARITTEIDGLTSHQVVESSQGSWRRYYENIANVLLRGEELAVTAESVRRVVAVLDVAMQSVRSGSSREVSI
ncbi:MAG: Gfo/Idh/MocA family oxidoreductase [Chloroflexi bacterium]|nr:Gfo/Idh/MocA family oxidoreductase [Chloroflexota bacterium]